MSMEDWYNGEELTERVQDLLDMSLYEEALELLENYGMHHDDPWEIHFLYSRVYSEQNLPNKALEHLKECQKIDNDNPDSLLALFYVYAQMGELAKGGKYLEKARKKQPNHELILNALLWYHVEMSEFSEALNIFEKHNSKLEYNPEALRNAGIAYEHMGNYDKALLCFKTSLELHPENEETLDLLADHFLLRGDASKCVEIYKEYLKRSPKNIKAMSRMVFCLTQSGKIKEGEEAAQKIIDTYPNSPVGYVDYSYLFFNTGRTKEAVEMADKALDVSPIDAEAIRVKAIAAAEMGHTREAEELFERSISYSPDNPEIRRDYYNFLKSCGRYIEMEKEVLKVIAQETPNCMEDYWFLAEHFREVDDHRKSFKYLLKAFRNMPGEKELIPPMVEILFEMRHFSFTVPILKNYLETRGWDNIMSELSTHNKLKGKWSQEGMRFLQFYGQKPTEYRRYAFLIYIRKALLISMILIFASLLLISTLFFGYMGALIFIISWGMAAFVTGRILTIRRRRMLRRERAADKKSVEESKEQENES